MKPYLVPQLLLEAAERAPDALAVVDPKRRLGYGDLVNESQRAAAALAAIDVGPGDLVAVSLEKSAAAVACLYGIMMRGAAYVPIDPSTPRVRVERILAHAEIRAVVTSPDRLAFFADARTAAPRLSRAVVVGGAAPAPRAGLVTATLETFAPEPRAHLSATDGYLAYVLHTSGSTGQPKGVAITHRNCLAFVEPAAHYFGVVPEDRLACQAPLHFDLSVFDLYCAALAGAGVVLLPEYFSAFPRKMAQAISQHGVTVWNSVVSALALLVQKGGLADAPRESLRAILFSGERMPMPLLREIERTVPWAELFNVYGQTEANSSLVQRVGQVPTDDGASLPLGAPLPNFEVFLLGEDGAVLEGAAQGELCVRAATVASGGYLRDPERARDKFVLDPRHPDSGMHVYRTGDLVRRDEEGRLWFAGRRDDTVKTRGYRVELGEIEAALAAVPGVVELAVVAVPDPSIGHKLCAFVCEAEGAGLTASTLAARLGEKLPPYMVPEHIEVRAELPRTSTGKVDKRALAADQAP